MFGYVRPILNELTQEQKTAYQSVYCGLCHTLGQRHGWLARFTLNYDFTLLALLHYGCSASDTVVCRRCPVHPFQKKRTCLCGTALDAAADESMILTWHKLTDDISDRNFVSGLPSRFLQFLFRKAYRRAAQARPEFDGAVRRELDRLSCMERENSPQMDRIADTFAKILAAAAADCADASQRRAMEQILYHLGRWIYLVDAWDDLEEDKRSGRYNPLNARFEGRAEEEREYVETTLTHSVRLVCSAFNLVEFGPWRAVIENIFYRGLPGVQNAVLTGRWKEMRKQRRNAHERSV